MSDLIEVLLRIESRSRKNGDAMKPLLLTIVICGQLLLAARPSWARKWSDAGGKFSVEAELVEVTADKVVLRKADGSEITVPLGASARSIDDISNRSGNPHKRNPRPTNRSANC